MTTDIIWNPLDVHEHLISPNDKYDAWIIGHFHY